MTTHVACEELKLRNGKELGRQISQASRDVDAKTEMDGNADRR